MCFLRFVMDALSIQRCIPMQGSLPKRYIAPPEYKSKRTIQALPKMKAAVKTSAPPPTTCSIEMNQFVPK